MKHPLVKNLCLYGLVLVSIGLAGSEALAEPQRCRNSDSRRPPQEVDERRVRFPWPLCPPFETLMVSFGFVGSHSFDGQGALGLELSAPWFRKSSLPGGLGPVVQWQRLQKRDRFFAGIEYAGLLGAELGWVVRRTETGWQQGGQLVPFLAFPWVAVGPRFTFLSGGTVEMGFNFWLKVPVTGKYPLQWH